ncbi:exonuclease domain-containing protein [Ramlibacter sp. 2FC]|uniref:3'-5' exonuclease n=1 Tax=Ramlibacter sp. 2FC TaxID=2502188 RepID=UPI0010F82A4A|nr:exonuclease domain-containing protein [Ramlibacter sp. 2FC]
MKRDPRRLLATLLPGGVLAAWTGLALALVAATLAEAERAVLGELLAPRAALLLLLGLVLAGGLGHAARLLYRDRVEAPARLLEAAQVLLAGQGPSELPARGSAENRGLARAIEALAAQRAQLQRDVEARVGEASQRIEQERSRLAALMSELMQSVVVCSLDGRVILYNQRARLQFRALSQAPEVAGGAELIGLGRSIYAVFDRPLIDHALERVQQRMAQDAASPAAQFVTTAGAGHLLRVLMTPVRAPAAQGERPAMSGYVLLLDDITRELEQESARDRLLLGLTERSRSALANMQAALDMLDYPDLDAALRDRFLAVVRDETAAMSRRIQDLVASSTDALKTRWPMEDMLGSDLLAAAARRIEAAHGLPCATVAPPVPLWLRVDSFSLLQALVYLAGRLFEEFGLRHVELRLGPAGPRAHLDLVWSGQVMNSETAMGWEMDPMKVGDETLPLSVRDVVERHGGAFWFERERASHQAWFRFLLPQASPQEPAEAALPAPAGSRPEYYDFDLFQRAGQAGELAERRLSELAYTVFDTETTGLDPSGGDEIIQVGAVRIVNGRLLRQEGFEQLVDPRRDIPAASLSVHGIVPELLRGRPTIEQVLPAFHAFARDTVLVAHNAAFDMRFLRLKEQAAGLHFDQPVLDTLLLSALVHPSQESHQLEAIAERFGIGVEGRHRALGDALLTAEVFLRLLPLLADQGIQTLGQALEAAQRTYYARLRY